MKKCILFVSILFLTGSLYSAPTPLQRIGAFAIAAEGSFQILKSRADLVKLRRKIKDTPKDRIVTTLQAIQRPSGSTTMTTKVYLRNEPTIETKLDIGLASIRGTAALVTTYIAFRYALSELKARKSDNDEKDYFN